jgi:hypothetical protein
MRLYGWRVYMVPVLAVVTTFLAVDGLRPHEPSSASAVSSVRGPRGKTVFHTGVGIPPIGNVISENTLKAGALPAGAPYTQHGHESWSVIPGSGDRFGPPDANKFFRYTIELEDGVDPASFINENAFASTVDHALHDSHSWIGGVDNVPGSEGSTYAFQRISAADAQGIPVTDKSFFRISLTSPATTQKECGYDIQLETSCFQPQDQRVVLNLARWVRGANAYGQDVQGYWTYMVNHEVGHAIGHPNHMPCPQDGDPAPIMMQQSFGVANNDIADLDPAGIVHPDGKICKPNPYPYP